jgi:hypothetical protein
VAKKYLCLSLFIRGLLHTEKMNQNYLKAVFWDYPQFQDYNSVKSALKKTRESNDTQTFRWLLTRFLERGRVKDVAMIFSISEVRENLYTLRLSDYAYKKWQRLLDVYESID